MFAVHEFCVGHQHQKLLAAVVFGPVHLLQSKRLQEQQVGFPPAERLHGSVLRLQELTDDLKHQHTANQSEPCSQNIFRTQVAIRAVSVLNICSKSVSAVCIVNKLDDITHSDELSPAPSL